MLKIKDNVDLKELEKYGFEKVTSANGNTEYKRSYYDDPETITTINAETREVISIYKDLVYDLETTKFVIVADLLGTDLLEEVEE